MRRAFTLIELLVVIAIIAILLSCVLGNPHVDAALRFTAYLVFGWLLFLWRLPSEMSIDVENSIIAAVCCALLAVGAHFVCRRLSSTWSWRWTAAGLGIVLLAAGAGISTVAVTHQSIWLTRVDEPWVTIQSGSMVARTVSTNNLKQMGLAVHNYHDQHKQLPAGGTFDVHGRGMHGWQTFLLPYIEERPLYERIDLAQPWDSPQNLPAMQQRIAIYTSPSVTAKLPDGPAISHYAGNVHVLGPRALTLKDITDGPANTILAGEAAGNYRPWGHPANWRDPAAGLNRAPNGFGRPGGEYVIFAFADGSTRTIADTVSPQVLRALSTPAGGEAVPEGGW